MTGQADRHLSLTTWPASLSLLDITAGRTASYHQQVMLYVKVVPYMSFLLHSVLAAMRQQCMGYSVSCAQILTGIAWKHMAHGLQTSTIHEKASLTVTHVVLQGLDCQTGGSVYLCWHLCMETPVMCCYLRYNNYTLVMSKFETGLVQSSVIKCT